MPYKLIEAAAAGDIELAISISTFTTPRAVPADVDDNHVIAVTGGAELVVSGDRRLLGLGSHLGIGVVNAAEFFRRAEDAKSKA